MSDKDSATHSSYSSAEGIRFFKKDDTAMDIDNDGSSQWKNVKFTSKAFHADITFEFLLQEIKNNWETSNPLVKVSHLYVFKALFEKSPMPRVMDFLIENGFLDILLEILDKEFVSSDSTNEVVLYRLAMEILWLFSKIHTAGIQVYDTSPILSQPVVAMVTKYTDIKSRFFQFSPVFGKKLGSLCLGTSFQHQKVTIVPMTPKIQEDLMFYQPWMSIYGAITHIYQCSLTMQPDDKPHKDSLAKRLITDNLAWPSYPQRKRPEKSVTEFVSDLVKNTSFVPPGIQSLEEKLNKKEGQFKDIVFLNTLGGPYFWAFVDYSSNLAMATNISDELHKHQARLKRFSPRVGNMVVMEVKRKEGEDADLPTVMRGRVLEVGESDVKVLALDYGVVETVKADCIFELSGPVAWMASVKPQAKVCSVAGVQAPPADEATLELALAFLVNLSKMYKETGVFFNEAGGLDNLYSLIQTAPPYIRVQAVRLLANVSSRVCFAKLYDWSPFVKVLLDLTILLSKNDDAGNLHRNTVVAVFHALSNIMFCKPAFQEMFFENNGHLIMLNFLRLNKSCVAITRAAASTLRAAYPGLMKALPKNVDNLEYQPGLISESDESDDETSLRADGKAEEEEDIHGATSQDREELSDEEITEMMTRVMPRHYLKEEARKMRAREEGEATDMDETQDTGRQRTAESILQFLEKRREEERQKAAKRRKEEEELSASENTDVEEILLAEEKRQAEETKRVLSKIQKFKRESMGPCLGGTRTVKEADNPGAKFMTDRVAIPFASVQQKDEAVVYDLVPVDGAFEKKVDNYELNTYVNFKEDMTHHFSDVQDVGSLGINNLTELICGMLNSKGGTIYLGFTKQGNVRGIRLNRSDRESLRLGLDSVMARTTPMILHTLLDMRYIPVLRRDTGSDALDGYQDVFVVEIEVKMPTETVFYIVTKDGACYQRFDTVNHQLKEQDVREMVVLEEESKYLPYMQSLRQRVQELLSELSPP